MESTKNYKRSITFEDDEENYEKRNNDETTTIKTNAIAIFEENNAAEPLIRVCQKILDEKKTISGKYFLIKWAGLPDTSNKWISERLIESTEIYLKYIENKYSKRKTVNFESPKSSSVSNSLPADKAAKKNDDGKMPIKQKNKENILDEVFAKIRAESVINSNALKANNQKNGVENKKAKKIIQTVPPKSIIKASSATSKLNSHQMKNTENMKNIQQNQCKPPDSYKLVPKILSKESSNKLLDTKKSAQKRKPIKRRNVASKKPKLELNEKNYPYEVESVLEDMVIDGKTYYLIKWKGYDSEVNTWEPVTSFAFPEKVLSFYHNCEK